MRSSISSSALHSAILASLALGSASGVSLGQTFNVSPLPTDTNPTATLTPAGGQFFRISNLTGVVGTSNASADLSSTTAASLGGADTDNYLSRIGQFTFANDFPIKDVTLSLRVQSISDTGGNPGTLDGVIDGSFIRSGFLMHDFGLLFVGSAGTEFVLTRSSANFTSPFSADENFSVTRPLSGGQYLQYIDQPNYDAQNNLIPQVDQLRSLEWLSSDLNDPDSSLAWQPDAFTPLDRTFPVTADLSPAVTDIGFYASRGLDTGAPALYAGGAGDRTWNIYLFSTGMGVPANLQLNLSEITVTLAVPEAGSTVAAGVALILLAGVLRSRRQA
jgi:hypothetical protein